jgi:hypothetical protein
MFRAHSFLWHYLWIGPHILQAVLVSFLWRRGFQKVFPAFFSYVLFETVEELTLYAMDILPSVSSRAWWVGSCLGLVVEGALMFWVVRELFAHLLLSRPAVARIGWRLIKSVAAILVLLAVVAGAYAPMDHPQYIWTYGAHVLLQSLYIVEGGLALFLFLFVAHFKLVWRRIDFGIAVGFGILFCEHMATYSVMATGALPYSLYPLLDFLNMGTYHLTVLIWCYYLLVPHKSAITSGVSLPENNLAVWNRELERLLQQ